MKKGILKNLSKFTEKQLCQSLFFNKVAGGACNFIKKETLAQVLSCEFCKLFKNTGFTELFWETASVACQKPIFTRKLQSSQHKCKCIQFSK